MARKDPAARAAYNREYYAKRQEELRAAMRAWYEANRETHKVRVHQYLKDNPEKRSVWRAKATAVWRAKNPHKARLYQATHRAQKRVAIPPWACTAEIETTYLYAHALRAVGLTHEVDHIIPLKHPLVCGLHVSDNLRVVPRRSNSAKSNHHWPEMP